MTAVAAPGTSAGSGGRGRAYVAIGVVVALVAAIVVLALVAPSRRTDGDPMDPNSTSATGTKAAVELARRLGADVSVTSELPDSGTQVAVLFEDLVAEDQVADVMAWVSAGHTLVVTDPYSSLTPVAEIGTAGPIDDQVTIDRGRCDAVDARRAHRPAPAGGHRVVRHVRGDAGRDLLLHRRRAAPSWWWSRSVRAG